MTEHLHLVHFHVLVELQGAVCFLSALHWWTQWEDWGLEMLWDKYFEKRLNRIRGGGMKDWVRKGISGRGAQLKKAPEKAGKADVCNLSKVK